MIKVTKFSTKTCRPCIAYGPVLKAAVNAREGFRLVELDLEADAALVAETGVSIQSVPFTLFESADGKVLGGFSGATTKAKLNKILDAMQSVLDSQNPTT